MKALFTVVLMLIGFISFGQTVYPTGLAAGDKAPQIVAVDNAGKKVNLKHLLKEHEVVLIFYRGQWCPYCNKELSRVNDSLSMITARGAVVITVTPETAENIALTVQKTKAGFPIIEDHNLAIMKNYKVNFTLDDATTEKYKGYGIDLTLANGSNGNNLPVPATYIIGKDGKIKYAFFNPDYRQRSSVMNILDHL